MKNTIKYLLYALLILVVAGAYLSIKQLYATDEQATDMLNVAAVFIYGYIFLRVTNSLLDKFLKKKVDRPKRKMVTKLWSYFIWIIMIVISIGLLTKSMETVGLSIGLLSAGLAFAMQQPVLNVAGWLVIMVKRPYKIGDRIVVEKVSGDVLDITVMYTVLREFGEFGEDTSGKIVTIPNAWILQSAILNYSGFNFQWIWDEETIALLYDSDYEKAEKMVIYAVYEVLKNELRDIKPKDLEFLGTKSIEPIVRISLKRDNIEMNIRHISRSLERRRIENEVSKAILKAIKKNPDVIKLSYPHSEIVLRKENVEVKL